MNAAERSARKAAKEARQRARRASPSFVPLGSRPPIRDPLWLAVMQGDDLLDIFDRADFSVAERRLFAEALPALAELSEAGRALLPGRREFLYEGLKAIRGAIKGGAT